MSVDLCPMGPELLYIRIDYALVFIQCHVITSYHGCYLHESIAIHGHINVTL